MSLPWRLPDKRGHSDGRIGSAGSHDGCELLAPDHDHIAGVVRRTGRPYEERLLSFLAHLMQREPAGTVVDVGANIGNHTVFFAKRGHQVIAVEANPVALYYLEMNIKPVEDRVAIWPVAAGAGPGRGRIAPDPTGQLGQAKFEFEPNGNVTVVVLDSIEDQVSLLKIDVEGGEPSVIMGALGLIRRSRPIIVAECWDARHRQEVGGLLHPLGYLRFPISLCWTPTYVYVPSKRLLLRAWATVMIPPVLVSTITHSLRKLLQRIRDRSGSND